MKDSQSPSDYDHPVAYDLNGRPLYYRQEDIEQIDAIVKNQSHVTTKPESLEGYDYNPRLRSQHANEPKVVHAERPIEPIKPPISEDLAKKHRLSAEKYPHLNLSDAEFVILDIKRHFIGLLIPVGISVMLIAFIIGFSVWYRSIFSSAMGIMMMPPSIVATIATFLSIFVCLGGVVSLWVYSQNQFFMTNESVIQEIQESLFSRHEQTVSLGSIEDSSFYRSGILQTIFNYGTIRLSTEGEETTYTFYYVANPKEQVAILNDAIEDFKNGRPVTGK